MLAKKRPVVVAAFRQHPHVVQVIRDLSVEASKQENPVIPHDRSVFAALAPRRISASPHG
jgi:hypothetical protein